MKVHTVLVESSKFDMFNDKLLLNMKNKCNMVLLCGLQKICEAPQ